MSMRDKYDLTYLSEVLAELEKQWPSNRTVHVVCHGHSVPAGYFATPYINTFGAYPHLLHRIIKERYPFAVVNVITTGIGGENSEQGAMRFEKEVLSLRPDVLTLDYALNDRQIGLQRALAAWESMIEKALACNVKIILLTPTWDQSYFGQDSDWDALVRHAEQIRMLARKYQVGLADVFQVFERYVTEKGRLSDLLSHINHPNSLGHQLAAEEIGKYFLAR